MGRHIIGIDPGANGGAAAIAPDGTLETCTWSDEGEAHEFIRTIVNRAAINGDEIDGALEEVGGFIGRAQPGSAMFKFGSSCGYLRGLLTAYGVRFVMVRPQTWQKGFVGKHESKAEHKRALKVVAQRLYPKHKVTLADADAILIAEWLKQSKI